MKIVSRSVKWIQLLESSSEFKLQLSLEIDWFDRKEPRQPKGRSVSECKCMPCFQWIKLNHFETWNEVLNQKHTEK